MVKEEKIKQENEVKKKEFSVTITPSGVLNASKIIFPKIIEDGLKEMERGECVVQEWLYLNCSWKQQTVVLCALRGCDGLIKGNPTKVLSRTLRNVVLKNADDSTSFMYNKKITDKQIRDFTDYLDSLPVHYVTHFTHGIEIVGYYHPDEEIRKMWNDIYLVICRNFHMTPETKEENKERLKDKN